MTRRSLLAGVGGLLVLTTSCGGCIEPDPDRGQAAVTQAPPFPCARTRDCNDARLTCCGQVGRFSDGTRGLYDSTCATSCPSTPVTAPEGVWVTACLADAECDGGTCVVHELAPWLGVHGWCSPR